MYTKAVSWNLVDKILKQITEYVSVMYIASVKL